MITILPYSNLKRNLEKSLNENKEHTNECLKLCFKFLIILSSKFILLVCLNELINNCNKFIYLSISNNTIFIRQIKAWKTC